MVLACETFATINDLHERIVHDELVVGMFPFVVWEHTNIPQYHRDALKEVTEENESIHKCLEVSQKVILSLKLYSSGLSKQVKELREQAEQDRHLIFDMSRRMGEMEIVMIFTLFPLSLSKS